MRQSSLFILCICVLAAGCITSTRPFAGKSPIPYSWQKSQAKIIPIGDLRWTPEPFIYHSGNVVRYIDFDTGSDANDGASKQAPWKHHPWDPAASAKSAQSAGVDTYVFKRGVTYRGWLSARDSGRIDLPIRLTSDPSWGRGDAAIAGPMSVTATTRPTLPSNIDIRDKNHIHISGLAFGPASGDASSVAIRVLGNCANIAVRNCVFQHVPAAMSATPACRDGVMDYIAFTDNRVQFTEHEALTISRPGDLRHVQVLRNDLREIGRSGASTPANHPPQSAPNAAIMLDSARYAHVAGNIIDRAAGAGISISGARTDAPPQAQRMLIHHNKVTKTMLAGGDAAIQTRQRGPFYVFDNIATNTPGRSFDFSSSFHTYAFNNPSTQGPRIFIPWGLAGPAGEWNFRRNPANPNLIRDDSFPSSPPAKQPGHDLQGNSFTAQSYTRSPLDDSPDGALTFNGVDQHLLLSDAQLSREVSADAAAGRRSLDMDTNSFLIEAYLRADPAHLSGAIVSKMGDRGYELRVTDDGGLSMMLRSARQISTVEQALVLADGKWHHILIEVDRVEGKVAFYIDGRFISSGGDVMAESLANKADFTVGRSSDGRCFAGQIDFLRICRGTLTDADTTLDELYAWEFNGPQFRDFAGNKLPFADRGPDATRK